jgi:prophage regulatory protein
MFPPVHAEHNSGDRVLIRAQLKGALGIALSNVTLLRLEEKGQFPRRFYLTEKCPVWLERDVIEWLRSKQAAVGAPQSTEQATAARRRRRHAAVAR